MKARNNIDENATVNGFYLKEVAECFFGPQDEGKWLLQYQGLDFDKLPFSVATLIREGKASWKDPIGRVCTISFKLKDDQIEFFGTYLGRKKMMRIFREWGDYESKEKIARLESEAIGNMCMKCIYESIPD